MTIMTDEYYKKINKALEEKLAYDKAKGVTAESYSENGYLVVKIKVPLSSDIIKQINKDIGWKTEEDKCATPEQKAK